MNTNNYNKKQTLTDILLNQCIIEFNKKETRDKINRFILDPIINDINKKIYPYFMTFTLIIMCILILILIIFFSLIIKKKNLE